MTVKLRKRLLISLVVLFGASPVLALDEAPDFTLTDITGSQFTLADHRGQVVLIDFFATWCGPCITEIEHLRALYADYPQDAVVILSVSVDLQDSDSDLAAFAQQHGIVWTVARDTDQVSSEYGVSYIPQLSIIDVDGYRRHDHVGVTPASTLSAELDALLSGAPDESDDGHLWGLYAAVMVIGSLIIGAIIWKRTRKSSRS